MAGRNQVELTFTADTKGFTKGMSAVDKSMADVGKDAAKFDNAMQGVGDGLGSSSGKFRSAADAADGLGTILGNSALGSVAMYAGGLSDLTDGLGGMSEMVGKAKAGIAAFGKFLLTNPLGILLTAVALITGALVLLYQKFEGIREFIDKLLGPLKSFAGAVSGFFSDLGDDSEELSRRLEFTSEDVDDINKEVEQLIHESEGFADAKEYAQEFFDVFKNSEDRIRDARYDLEELLSTPGITAKEIKEGWEEWFDAMEQGILDQETDLIELNRKRGTPITRAEARKQTQAQWDELDAIRARVEKNPLTQKIVPDLTPSVGKLMNQAQADLNSKPLYQQVFIKKKETYFSSGGKSENPWGSLSARAAGGPVSAGVPYMVGEGGREMFVPGMDGAIVPNSKMRNGSGSGGTTVIQLVLDGKVLTESVYSGLLTKQRRTGNLGLT